VVFILKLVHMGVDPGLPINAHFGDAFSRRLNIAGVPLGNPFYTLIDTESYTAVIEVFKPLDENIRPANGHNMNVYYSTHNVRGFFKAISGFLAGCFVDFWGVTSGFALGASPCRGRCGWLPGQNGRTRPFW
jgi:hypothetical protein